MVRGPPRSVVRKRKPRSVMPEGELLDRTSGFVALVAFGCLIGVSAERVKLANAGEEVIPFRNGGLRGAK